MKIIISPTKTQLKAFTQSSKDYIPENPMTYRSDEQERMTRLILSILLSNDLGRLYKDKATHYKKHYEHFETQFQCPAIYSHTGLVFKQLDLDAYSKKDFDYIDQHIIILSALYGLTSAFDPIRPYRLDFQMKLDHLNLYEFWHEHVKDLLAHEDLIIDLASNEFSKMVTLPKITIYFRDEEQGKLMNKATYTKMARGKMLHLMITKRIKTTKALKSVTFDGYVFAPSISNPNNFYFVRSINR